MFEAHFGVPMTGAVLNTLNTRLDPEAIAFMLRARRGQRAAHRPRVLPDDRKALAMLGARRPLVIDVEDLLAPPGRTPRRDHYEAFWTRATRPSPGSCQPTSGTRSR
jgi:fatty-acyl-CoA synthase